MVKSSLLAAICADATVMAAGIVAAPVHAVALPCDRTFSTKGNNLCAVPAGLSKLDVRVWSAETEARATSAQWPAVKARLFWQHSMSAPRHSFT